MNDSLCIVPYPGGKTKSADWILSYFPACKTYLEPFVGAASIVLAKPPSEVEIVNDINGDLVNMLTTIRDYPEEVARFLDLTPYSRLIFESWWTDWKMGVKGATALERAVRLYYLYSTSFSAKLTGSFSTGKEMNKAPAHFSRLEDLPAISRRLRNVVIEQMDFEQFLLKYDGENVFVYCDPPYILSRRENYYIGSNIWGPEEHRRLARVIRCLQARVAISYYSHPLLDELYPRGEGWKRAYLGTFTTVALVKAEAGGRQDTRTEMLVMNYSYGQASLWPEREKEK